ncbi:MAG: hypothetical protein Q8P59_05055 [Dehalococcoidia bacterium]|nr:hypothetical protein [Dehalococcoidia bacterium]
MPRACTVCGHPEREAIDHALVRGESPVSLSARYSTIGRMALVRHRDNHLPATMIKAQEAQEVARADSLLSQVRTLQEKALGILGKAEVAGDFKTVLGAIREARSNIELLAKLLVAIQQEIPGNMQHEHTHSVDLSGLSDEELDVIARIVGKTALQHLAGGYREAEAG